MGYLYQSLVRSLILSPSEIVIKYLHSWFTSIFQISSVFGNDDVSWKHPHDFLRSICGFLCLCRDMAHDTFSYEYPHVPVTGTCFIFYILLVYPLQPLPYKGHSTIDWMESYKPNDNDPHHRYPPSVVPLTGTFTMSAIYMYSVLCVASMYILYLFLHCRSTITNSSRLILKNWANVTMTDIWGLGLLPDSI